MKKVAFMFVAALAISFASCGNSTKAGECADSCCDSTVDSTVVEQPVDTTVADSVVADSTVQA